jgi:hypothetical protein
MEGKLESKVMLNQLLQSNLNCATQIAAILRNQEEVNQIINIFGIFLLPSLFDYAPRLPEFCPISRRKLQQCPKNR